MRPEPPTDNSIAGTRLSRRGMLRAGGMTISLAVLVAACSDIEPDENPARIGTAPPLPVLPEGVVSDGVIFRTAVSMHYSFIDAHNMSKRLGDLDPEQTALIDNFIQGNKDAIEDLDVWTRQAGSDVWTCANSRFNRVTLIPIRDHITGRPKIGNEEADVPPSDDPNRDCMALAVAIENLSTAMHQAFVQSLNKPEYRGASINQGQFAARRAALVALEINPENIVNPTSLANANVEVPTTVPQVTTTTAQDIAQPEGGSTTTAVPTITAPQQWYAVPSQFGSLSAVQLSVGAPTSSGTQFTINMETPSLNSYIYDYETTEDCGVQL